MRRERGPGSTKASTPGGVFGQGEAGLVHAGIHDFSKFWGAFYLHLVEQQDGSPHPLYPKSATPFSSSNMQEETNN